MVLSAVADIVRGISRPRIAARWSARSATSAWSHGHPSQTGQRDGHDRDLQRRRRHGLSLIRNVRKCDIVRRRSGLRLVVKYGDSVH
jgi:hypothetical protein